MKNITRIIAAMALSVMLSGLSMAQVSVWDGSAEPWTHGSGTEEDPYLIESAANLAWLAQKCQEGSLTGFNFLDTYFLLTVDLDLGGDEGLEWMPIGGRGYSFSGNFDGGGHIIDNMYISGRGLLQEPPMAGMVLIGLFGKLEQGSIRNLTMGERCLLELNELTGLCYAGMLAGAVITYRTYWPDYFLPHLISNCHNRGSIQVTLPDDQQIVAVGGLVGFTNPGLRMEGCSNSGALSLEMPMRRLLAAAYLRYIGPCLGGLVGMDYDMYDGLLTYWDDDPVGPFEFVMEDCHNTGSLRMGLDLISYEARKRAYAGGIVGNAGYRVSLNRCSNRGDVTVTMRSSTGLADYDEFLPFCSGVAGGYANDFDPNYGSHMGQFVANITNCYNHAPVRCEVEEGSGLQVETVASGITGRPISESELVPEVNVSNCYHVGELSAGTVCGITPFDETELLEVNNSYYLEGDAPDNGLGEPMTEETMQSQAFVEVLNGDGPETFYWDQWEVNGGYPVLDKEWFFVMNPEWYYEIQCDNGSVYYQYLRCAGDTVVDNHKAKVIVRTNQIYDKEGPVEVTREYLYEEDDIVYWWNRDLQAFTVLYDFDAEEGDEWEVKVGTETVVLHVDGVKPYYDPNTGRTYRTLYVSDADDLFSGEIICGIGHMTSFFPERLMNRGAAFEVDGLRCYWNNQELVFHASEDDCDAIYSEVHEVDEIVADAFRVYPNPTDGLLRVERNHETSLEAQPAEYRITNVMGQTVLRGTLADATIDVSALPLGVYFLTMEGQTVKLMKQ